MKPSEQVKRNLIRHKRIRRRYGRHPDGAEYEDEPFAVQIGDAAPEEQEAAESEGVGRDDPLLAAFGDGEVVADGGEDDDDALDGEGLLLMFDVCVSFSRI